MTENNVNNPIIDADQKPSEIQVSDPNSSATAPDKPLEFSKEAVERFMKAARKEYFKNKPAKGAFGGVAKHNRKPRIDDGFAKIDSNNDTRDKNNSNKDIALKDQ